MKTNYTLDAPSPVLKYSGSWSPVSASDDPSVSQYANGTALKTSTTGDSVQFNFNGTGVWFYGAQRSNHGRYNVIIDTDTFTQSGRTASGNDAFQQNLFGFGNLTSGPHSVTVTNLGFSNGSPGYFDLDYIIWEGSLPDSSTEAVFQSRDAGFEYLPGPDWWSWGYSNVSYSPVLYYTQSSSAAFRFNFTGESVELFGYLDKNHGNFSCEVDGVSRGVYSGYYPSKLYQQVLCFGDNLDDGDHILEVKNIPIDTNDGWFSIDYARVRGSNPGRAKSKGSSSNTASIIGGTVGGLVFLACLASLFAFCFLRRRKRQQNALLAGGRRVSRPIPHRDVPDFEIEPSSPTQRRSRLVLGGLGRGGGGQPDRPVMEETEGSTWKITPYTAEGFSDQQDHERGNDVAYDPYGPSGSATGHSAYGGARFPGDDDDEFDERPPEAVDLSSSYGDGRGARTAATSDTQSDVQAAWRGHPPPGSRHVSHSSSRHPSISFSPSQSQSAPRSRTQSESLSASQSQSRPPVPALLTTSPSAHARIPSTSKRFISNPSPTRRSSRYLAPQPELDAGPLLLPHGSSGEEEPEEEDDEERRAVGQGTLPPVYTSIVRDGHPPAGDQVWRTDR